MQAVILAADKGHGLGEHAADIPKCMVEVNGVRLIDRLIGQLTRFGVDRIIIVDGYESETLRDHVEKICTDVPVLFVENDLYDQTNNIFSLWLAIHYLLDDNTLLVNSDLILEDALLESIYECEYGDVALISEPAPWMNGMMAETDADDDIVRFIPRERLDSGDGADCQATGKYFKTVNVYKFSPEYVGRLLLPFLEAYMNAFGTDDCYEEVLRVITSIGKVFIKGLATRGLKWYEIDDAGDLKNAERIFA